MLFCLLWYITCLVFNLGHNYVICVTVTDGYRRVQCDINRQLNYNFFRRRIDQPGSSFSSICIVFCIVVHVIKRPVFKRLAYCSWPVNHQRNVLCQEFMFELVKCINLLEPLRQSKQLTCKQALTCWSLIRTVLNTKSG